jgi:hypothetical protein
MPLGPYSLCAEAQQIHAERLHVHRHLAERLDGVGVNHDTPGARQSRDLGDRLNHARIVVGEHYGDDGRVSAQCGGNRPGIQATLVIDRQQREGMPGLFEVAAGIEARLVLDGGGEDTRRSRLPLPRCRRWRGCWPPCPTGEDDFRGLGADQARHLYQAGR